MSIFVPGNFTSHSGKDLTWKLESDNFTEQDWELFARIAQPLLKPYGEVIGIPKGGLPFAHALEQYITPTSGITLIVDDVWTTGKSLKEAKAELESHGQSSTLIYGLVVFDRSTDLTRPWWMDSLFKASVRLAQ